MFTCHVFHLGGDLGRQRTDSTVNASRLHVAYEDLCKLILVDYENNERKSFRELQTSLPAAPRCCLRRDQGDRHHDDVGRALQVSPAQGQLLPSHEVGHLDELSPRGEFLFLVCHVSETSIKPFTSGASPHVARPADVAGFRIRDEVLSLQAFDGTSQNAEPGL